MEGLMNIFLPVFGLVFGVVLILDGIFGWGLVKIIPGSPGSSNLVYVRISEGIIGVIFVVLAILSLAGVF
jgi:hypothetical protein